MKTKEIKVSFMWENDGSWLEFKYTLDEIVGGKVYDDMSDNPLLRNYRLKASRAYTGLKDRFGKEIYEGDIMKASEKHETCYVVEDVGGHYTVGKGWSMLHLCAEEWIKIGNVYENPELLKGAHT